MRVSGVKVSIVVRDNCVYVPPFKIIKKKSTDNLQLLTAFQTLISTKFAVLLAVACDKHWEGGSAGLVGYILICEIVHAMIADVDMYTQNCLDEICN